uniref:hypothetical protein n=1 Tax=Microseira wollei TaxID=467598 RepID=UPI001CFD3634|nr:hypothetical protein [Microseira wollei]
MMRKCHVRFLGEGDKATCSPLPDYVNLCIEDSMVPNFMPDEIVPTWDNSTGMDAVLHEDDFLALSDGQKLPSLKSFRKTQSKLANVSKRKSARKQGSNRRRSPSET